MSAASCLETSISGAGLGTAGIVSFSVFLSLIQSNLYTKTCFDTFVPNEIVFLLP